MTWSGAMRAAWGSLGDGKREGDGDREGFRRGDERRRRGVW